MQLQDVSKRSYFDDVVGSRNPNQNSFGEDKRNSLRSWCQTKKVIGVLRLELPSVSDKYAAGVAECCLGIVIAVKRLARVAFATVLPVSVGDYVERAFNPLG